MRLRYTIDTVGSCWAVFRYVGQIRKRVSPPLWSLDELGGWLDMAQATHAIGREHVDDLNGMLIELRREGPGAA